MALADNLVGWWCPSLDDAGNGTATLTDLSGNGNSGTLTNMDAETDWVSDTGNGGTRALDFDGTNDHVIIPSTISTLFSDSKITVSIWVKPRQTEVNTSFIGSDFNSGAVRYSIGWQGNKIASGFFPGNWSAGATTTDTPNLNAWQNLVGVYDGQTNRLYRDGVLIATTSATGNMAGQGVWYFGRRWDRNEFCDFQMDNCSIYKTDLSATDVAEIYNGGRSLDLLGGVGESLFNNDIFRNPVFDNPTFRGSTLR